MATNETYRTHKKMKPFTMVDNDLINDPTLSWAAKGLLIYLFSKPDNWKVYKADIVKHATNSKDSVSAIFKELRNTGYMTLTRITNARGQVHAWRYDFYEEPLEKPIPEYLSEQVQEEQQAETSCQGKATSKNKTKVQEKKEDKDTNNAQTSTTHNLKQFYKKKTLDYNEVVAYLKTSLDFDTLQKNPKFKEKLEDWIFIIADYLSTKNSYIQMGQLSIPKDIVANRMLQISQYHIEQVIDNLAKVERPIKNIKQYIFSALYNSLSTLDTEIEIDLQTSL